MCTWLEQSESLLIQAGPSQSYALVLLFTLQTAMPPRHSDSGTEEADGVLGARHAKHSARAPRPALRVAACIAIPATVLLSAMIPAVRQPSAILELMAVQQTPLPPLEPEEVRPAGGAASGRVAGSPERQTPADTLPAYTVLCRHSRSARMICCGRRTPRCSGPPPWQPPATSTSRHPCLNQRAPAAW